MTWAIGEHSCEQAAVFGAGKGAWIGWECEVCRENVSMHRGVGRALRARFLSFGAGVEVLECLGELSNEMLVVLL